MWSTIGRGQDPPPGLQSIASVTKGIYSRVLRAFEQVPKHFVPLYHCDLPHHQRKHALAMGAVRSRA
jgi:hypothetical protein